MARNPIPVAGTVLVIETVPTASTVDGNALVVTV